MCSHAKLTALDRAYAFLTSCSPTVPGTTTIATLEGKRRYIVLQPLSATEEWRLTQEIYNGNLTWSIRRWWVNKRDGKWTPGKSKDGFQLTARVRKLLRDTFTNKSSFRFGVEKRNAESMSAIIGTTHATKNKFAQ